MYWCEIKPVSLLNYVSSILSVHVTGKLKFFQIDLYRQTKMDGWIIKWIPPFSLPLYVTGQRPKKPQTHNESKNIFKKNASVVCVFWPKHNNLLASKILLLSNIECKQCYYLIKNAMANRRTIASNVDWQVYWYSAVGSENNNQIHILLQPLNSTH